MRRRDITFIINQLLINILSNSYIKHYYTNKLILTVIIINTAISSTIIHTVPSFVVHNFNFKGTYHEKVSRNTIEKMNTEIVEIPLMYHEKVEIPLMFLDTDSALPL